MSILRTDDEADSVEILKLVIETGDYYREMAEIVEDESLASELNGIATDRAGYIKPLKNVVEELGELPAQPDPDKELVQRVGGEIAKLFSADSKNAILDKCLQEDEKLADILRDTKLGERSAEFKKLLGALSHHLSNTQKSVQALKS